jgi:pimeloyl-ACP methyl ester carboxylesterase
MITFQHMRSKSLYLHMGPGMNAEPEKSALSEQNPHVVFWNQPLMKTPTNAFLELVNATKKQLEILSIEGNKVNIIGHCFGVNIAMECLATHADLIEECQFIAPTFCMNDFLLSLLGTLATNPKTQPSLKSEINVFLSEDYLPNRFWEGYNLVIKDADFFRCYWSNSENYTKYLSFADKLLFDQETFKIVVDDFLAREAKPPFHFRGKVNVFIGADDPMMKNQSLIQKNLEAFPQKTVHIVENAGHFPHFESSIFFI